MRSDMDDLTATRHGAHFLNNDSDAMRRQVLRATADGGYKAPRGYEATYRGCGPSVGTELGWKQVFFLRFDAI